MINIEVAYATPEKQTLMSVQVEEGATVGEAILSCGIIETHPEINLGVNKVGVWNRTTKLETVLSS